MNRIILALALVAGMTASTQATAPTLTLSDSYCTNPSAQFLDLARQNAYNLISTNPIPFSGLTPTLTWGPLKYLPQLPNYHNATCFKGLDPNVSKQSGLGLEQCWEVLKGNHRVSRTNFGFGAAIARHAKYYDQNAQQIHSLSGIDKSNQAMADGLREAQAQLFGKDGKTGALENLAWYKSNGNASAIEREFLKAANLDNIAAANAARESLRQQYDSLVATRKIIADACRAKGATADDIKKYLDKVMPLPDNQVAAFRSATKDPIPVISHIQTWLTNACQDMFNFGDKFYHGDKSKKGQLGLRFGTHAGSYLLGYYLGEKLGKKCGLPGLGKHLGGLMALGLSYHCDAPGKMGIE